MEVEIKEMRRIEAGRKERREMVIMELGSEKERWEVIENKRKMPHRRKEERDGI